MKKILLTLSVLFFCFFSSLSFAQLATHVVIAEVFGGGGNTTPSAPYLNDYIVLYNPTLAAVDVSGWSIQYAAATSTSWATTNLVGSIPAQSYYLIQEGAGSGGAGINLPFYPAVIGTFGIGPTTGGKVALVNNQTTLAVGPTLPDASIIDFVGFNNATTTASVYEGTGPATTMSNILSIRRKDNGGAATNLNYGLTGSGWDSNDNSADFFQQGNLSLIPNYPLSTSYLANHVVIAEVYGGGGLPGASYTNDYVVLYNSSASDVNLSTESLQYTSATGTVWATINLTGTITAKKYYLIQLGSGGANGVALPETPNLTDATDIDVSNGKIALVRNQIALSGANPVTSGPDIVDMVGYGASADGYEGTIGPSSSPGNTNSIRRKDRNNANSYGLANGSGYDANNNSSDFYVESDIINNPPAPSSAKANHLVIAEIYTGGGSSSATYLYDYVVLYNPTGSSVDVSTWSLQRATTATGSDWSTPSGAVVLLTGSVPANSYYLIQGKSAGAVGGSLPVTPDVINIDFNLNGTAGKIALVNNTTPLTGQNPLPNASIIDFVGYGTGVTAYEGIPTIAPSSNSSSIRRRDNFGAATYGTNGSGWDTDINNDNFYNQTNPVPLPVELSFFSASIIGTNVKLSWKTETEVNNYGFEVERASLSASPLRGWEKIGFVNGNGNSNSPKDYSFVDNSAANGSYSYRLKQIDNDGQFEFSKTIEVALGAPKKFELSQNYPNPFNPTTTIKFTMPEAGNVKLTLFNILGQEVKTLVNGFKESGVHTVDFNASELNSGIYIYKIESGSFVQTRKMTLLK